MGRGGKAHARMLYFFPEVEEKVSFENTPSFFERSGVCALFPVCGTREWVWVWMCVCVSDSGVKCNHPIILDHPLYQDSTG
jgi:hypothetical protein